MKLKNLVSAYMRGLDAITEVISQVACGFLLLMVFVVCLNVFGRFVFGKPLQGVLELVEVALVPIGFFAIVYAQQKRSQVSVDIIVSRLSRRAQAILGSLGFFLGLVLYAIITYKSMVIAWSYTQNLSHSTIVWHIPFGPVHFMMVLGFLLLCLWLLIHIFRPIPPQNEKRDG